MVDTQPLLRPLFLPRSLPTRTSRNAVPIAAALLRQLGFGLRTAAWSGTRVGGPKCTRPVLIARRSFRPPRFASISLAVPRTENDGSGPSRNALRTDVGPEKQRENKTFWQEFVFTTILGFCTMKLWPLPSLSLPWMPFSYGRACPGSYTPCTGPSTPICWVPPSLP